MDIESTVRKTKWTRNDWKNYIEGYTGTAATEKSVDFHIAFNRKMLKDRVEENCEWAFKHVDKVNVRRVY